MDNGKCTLTKLASIVGVAPSTISRVLSGAYSKIPVTEATVKRIREEAERHGYCPNINARRLLNKRAFVIGLEVPALNIGIHSFADATLVETMRGVEDIISAGEYKLMILFKGEGYLARRENLKLIRENAIDGLLVWGGSLSDSYAPELCDLPVVFVNTLPKLERKANYVGSDNAAASFELVKHAISKGCRKFVYFAGPGTNSIDVERMEGFKRALSTWQPAGACCERVFDCDYTEASAFGAMDSVLSNARVFFDCAICANDSMAVGVFAAAAKHGLSIPRDFRLAGGDGLIPDAARLGLTTFKSDCFKLGSLATERVLALVEGKSRARQVETKVPCQLLKRDTL